MTPRTPAELRSLLARFPDGLAFDPGNTGELGPGYGLTDELGYPVRLGVRPKRRAFSGPMEGEWAEAGQDARSIVALHNLGEKFAALWEAAEGYMDSSEGSEIEAARILRRALADLRGGK